MAQLPTPTSDLDIFGVRSQNASPNRPWGTIAQHAIGQLLDYIEELHEYAEDELWTYDQLDDYYWDGYNDGLMEAEYDSDR